MNQRLPRLMRPGRDANTLPATELRRRIELRSLPYERSASPFTLTKHVLGRQLAPLATLLPTFFDLPYQMQIADELTPGLEPGISRIPTGRSAVSAWPA